MKKITLIVASVVLTSGFINATPLRITSIESRMRYNLDEPISFTERGIVFFVFLNGEFDFNTRPNDNQGNYYYKSIGKRGLVTSEKRIENYGVRIEQDSYGRVRRIGNTFINYDNRDRVSRIGSVYMSYNRFTLTQIGGLRIMYNHRGDIVSLFGSVKGYCETSPTNNFYNHNDIYPNNFYPNENYYYKQSVLNEKKEKQINED